MRRDKDKVARPKRVNRHDLPHLTSLTLRDTVTIQNNISPAATRCTKELQPVTIFYSFRSVSDQPRLKIA